MRSQFSPMGMTLLAIAALVAASCSGSTSPSPSAAPATPTSSAAAPSISASPATPEATPSLAPSSAPSPSAPALRLPEPNAGFDYQLGGGYPPPAGVTVVSRDRTEAPDPALYTICYVNGFQIQPGDVKWWKANHPDVILRDTDGKIVIDRDWNEIMLAPTTPANRAELAGVIGDWIAKCAADGFDAVEIDNLDTFTRTHGLITEDDAVAQVRLFADAAHAAGLPIAQKNSAEITGRRADMGTDFAVAEECDRWNECDAYTSAYGDNVLVIEYRRRDFDAGCAAYPNLSIVLRDLDLVRPNDKGYVFKGC